MRSDEVLMIPSRVSATTNSGSSQTAAIASSTCVQNVRNGLACRLFEKVSLSKPSRKFSAAGSTMK